MFMSKLPMQMTAPHTHLLDVVGQSPVRRLLLGSALYTAYPIRYCMHRITSEMIRENICSGIGMTLYTGINISGSAVGNVTLCIYMLSNGVGCRAPIQAASTMPGVA